ncbi:hypothetical protein [Cellulomonas soli]
MPDERADRRAHRDPRRGDPDAVARRLGLDQGLVDAAIDHWVRLGVVTSVCAGPRAPGAACAAATPACAGCPVAPRR